LVIVHAASFHAEGLATLQYNQLSSQCILLRITNLSVIFYFIGLVNSRLVDLIVLGRTIRSYTKCCELIDSTTDPVGRIVSHGLKSQGNQRPSKSLIQYGGLELKYSIEADIDHGNGIAGEMIILTTVRLEEAMELSKQSGVIDQ